MSEEQNKQTVEELYAAFGRGDIDSIVAKCTKDVEWITHLDPIVPWSGDHSGKDFVPAFFGAIFGSVEVTAFEPEDWIVDGNTVVNTGRFACHVRSTGKNADTRWVFIWKFTDDGMISRYEQFHDENIAEAFIY
ncbi:MAG TPA: nuclear transport factor 2 family protein [Pyrinomonadaceae bacterium]|nr:nuclear transport factor 2 family protein [Pyrinomonadaceae bacterium]